MPSTGMVILNYASKCGDVKMRDEINVIVLLNMLQIWPALTHDNVMELQTYSFW